VGTGIATVFKGIEYRSRHEAKWAAFMSSIGWEYTYEPFDGDGYIPDFIVYGDWPMFVEVKPVIALSEFVAEEAKVTKGLASFEKDVTIVGSTPVWSDGSLCYDGSYAAGWLGEYYDASIDGSTGFNWAAAAWSKCHTCGIYSVQHDYMNYVNRVCGHHNSGDDRICADGWTRPRRDPLEIADLKAKWAVATNEVKWRGRAAS